MIARRGLPYILVLALLPACAGEDQPTADIPEMGESDAGDVEGEPDTFLADVEDEGEADVPDEPDVVETGPQPLPPLGSVPLTTVRVLEVLHEQVVAEDRDPRVPAERDAYVAEGFGDYRWRNEGEPVQDLTLDGVAPPEDGSAELVARFVHLADVQLTDDESPNRVASLDAPDLFDGAFRPQEGHGCRLLDAAVRTINAVHTELPLDLVVLGGDNIDNAQQNELDWFQATMGGAPLVDCDSGNDDDPVPGPGNDLKDPFAPVGLDVPWLWVTGNHDILVQGNFTVGEYAQDAVSDFAERGTRDWSQPGGPVVDGIIVADERRAVLTREALVAAVVADGDGHGLTDLTIPDKAYYTYDIEGSPVRFVVVDTAAETGGAVGVVHQADVDAFLRPALEAAEADGRWVIVVSHHAAGSLSNGDVPFGELQEDAITSAAFRQLLGEFDSVIMHLAAHSHANRVEVIEPEVGHPYWEVRTASLIDYPQQMRLIEVHDQQNGYLTITGIALDFLVDGDPVADEGRRLAIVDYTSGWQNSGTGRLVDRNVRLWVPAP